MVRHRKGWLLVLVVAAGAAALGGLLMVRDRELPADATEMVRQVLDEFSPGVELARTGESVGEDGRVLEEFWAGDWSVSVWQDSGRVDLIYFHGEFRGRRMEEGRARRIAEGTFERLVDPEGFHLESDVVAVSSRDNRDVYRLVWTHQIGDVLTGGRFRVEIDILSGLLMVVSHREPLVPTVPTEPRIPRSEAEELALGQLDPGSSVSRVLLWLRVDEVSQKQQLIWTIVVTAADGERTSVLVDAHEGKTLEILPESFLIPSGEPS